MKIQNKTKTTMSIMASIVIGLVILSPTTVIPHVSAQNAITQNNPTSLSKVTDQYLFSITPAKLSDSDMTEYKNIIMNNNEVKAAINGNSYEFGSYGFIGNIYKPNANWYPEIHITANTKSGLDKDIAVVIDPATKSIRKVQTVSYNPHNRNTGGANNAWSVQRFGGNSGTPDGILENETAPSFTWDGNNRNGVGNAHLLNALMAGSTWNNACTKGTSGTYWAQIGFIWETSGQITWDDTNSGPIGCGNNFVTSPAYVAGKTYQFRIVGATSGWGFYAIRADTGDTFVHIGPSVSSDQMSVSSSNDGTSTFYENKYASTDPSWYGQYGTVPNARLAQYKTTAFGSYSNWGSVTMSDESCTSTNGGNVYPYNLSQQVMDNPLSSGGTAHWSVQNMQTYYPAC